MRKWLSTVAVAAVVMTCAAAALAGNGTPINTGSANALTLAVYGDAPYGTTQTDTSEFEATPAFIDAINSDPKVDLVVHVGDIHSGKQLCSESYNNSVADLWTQFKDPLIYTPGDNEWTDCQKAAEGGGDPLTNLALVRSIFFSNPGYTLGGRQKQVLSQAQNFDPAHPADANYVENVMWEQSKTLFVTLNIPGGSNNDADIWFGASTMSAAQSQEIAQRTGADLRWLDAAFAQAHADDVDAVVIVEQADMWDLDGKTPAHLTGYDPFVQSIAVNTAAFGKPVLLFNGDSHTYRSDNPLAASDPLNYLHAGYDVPNFHRVVVHGSTVPLEYLRLTIDPGTSGTAATAFGPFSWEHILP